MRSALLAVAVAVSGCGGGGVPPEVYALVLTAIATPAGCFATPPTDTFAKAPLGTTNVTVWDAAESKAFLNPDTSLSFDMGDAPTVSVSSAQVLEGTSGPTGWTFVGETDVTDVQTVIATRTINTKTRIEVAFQRVATGTGTMTLSSSQTCTGSGCPTTMPTCTISAIPMRTTRLAVDFERTP